MTELLPAVLTRRSRTVWIRFSKPFSPSSCSSCHLWHNTLQLSPSAALYLNTLVSGIVA